MMKNSQEYTISNLPNFSKYSLFKMSPDSIFQSSSSAKYLFLIQMYKRQTVDHNQKNELAPRRLAARLYKPLPEPISKKVLFSRVSTSSNLSKDSSASLTLSSLIIEGIETNFYQIRIWYLVSLLI